MKNNRHKSLNNIVDVYGISQWQILKCSTIVLVNQCTTNIGTDINFLNSSLWYGVFISLITNICQETLLIIFNIIFSIIHYEFFMQKHSNSIPQFKISKLTQYYLVTQECKLKQINYYVLFYNLYFYGFKLKVSYMIYPYLIS